MRNENKTSISSKDIFSQAGFLRPWPPHTTSIASFKLLLFYGTLGELNKFTAVMFFLAKDTNKTRVESSIFIEISAHQGVAVLANSHAGAFSTFL